MYLTEYANFFKPRDHKILELEYTLRSRDQISDKIHSSTQAIIFPKKNTNNSIIKKVVFGFYILINNGKTKIPSKYRTPI